MPVQITVGPPVITIDQGSTFMVTDQRGEIDLEREQGLFAGAGAFSPRAGGVEGATQLA